MTGPERSRRRPFVPRVDLPDPSGGPPVLKLRLDVSGFAGKKFFDVRRRTPLAPKDGALEIDMDAGDGRPIAVLPYDAPALKLTATRENDRLTVAVSAAGEVSHPGNGVDTLTGLDPDDTREKTLRAVLRDGLAPGIFAVRWRSQAKRGRGERSGMYYFGVQRAPPEEVHGWSGSPVHERDLGPWNRQRLGRNALLASGLILIALAAMVQRRPRSG